MTTLTLVQLASIFEAKSNVGDKISAFHEAMSPFKDGQYVFVTDTQLKSTLGSAFTYTIDDMREYQDDLEHGPKQVFRESNSGHYTEVEQTLAGLLINHFFYAAFLDVEQTFRTFVEEAGIVSVFPGVLAIPLPKPILQVPENPIA